MTRCRTSVALAWTALAVLIAPVAANHTEQRQYAILVDGKEAGQSSMTIVEQTDGSVYMSGSAKVSVQALLAQYSLHVEVQEWWKDGKLIGLKSTCNENSKKYEVLVSPHAMGHLVLRVNGQERTLRPDVWPTSYWKLADARFHNKPVPLLTVDSGQEKAGQLQYIGPKQLPVANQLVSCYHFRVTGNGSPTDLWYDQHHRLVRQEFVESGHKTIVQLVSKK